jgi:hypothetical protein
VACNSAVLGSLASSLKLSRAFGLRIEGGGRTQVDAAAAATL